MSGPKQRPGGIWRYLVYLLLCLTPIAMYFLGYADPKFVTNSMPVDKAALWSQSIQGQIELSGLESDSGSPALEGRGIEQDAPSSGEAEAEEFKAEVEQEISGGSVEATVEAGKTDHTPFVVDKLHLGREPFNPVIAEFLRTAERSPPNPPACQVVDWAWMSNCPGWTWLAMYHGPDKEKRPAVFVDIGCNKGYSIASFYEQFAPRSGVSKESICKLHKEMGTGKYQGVCRDCSESPRLGTFNSGNPPEAYCIDGSPYTHQRTKEIAGRLQRDQPLAQGWKLFHHAMTNATGTITYENCNNEDCGIRRPGDKIRAKKGAKTVPAMTYDAFAKAHGIKWADLVKIDTEGEEPLIIQGMHESLKARRIGFLAFEVHGTGKGWYRAFDMKRLVDLLDAYGYNCYMDSASHHTSGQQAKIMLLTGCEHRRFSQSYVYNPDSLEIPYWYVGMKGVIPQWGNAICGLRTNTEIANILTELSHKSFHDRDSTLPRRPGQILRSR